MHTKGSLPVRVTQRSRPSSSPVCLLPRGGYNDLLRGSINVRWSSYEYMQISCIHGFARWCRRSTDTRYKYRTTYGVLRYLPSMEETRPTATTTSRSWRRHVAVSAFIPVNMSPKNAHRPRVHRRGLWGKSYTSTALDGFTQTFTAQPREGRDGGESCSLSAQSPLVQSEMLDVVDQAVEGSWRGHRGGRRSAERRVSLGRRAVSLRER